MGLEVNSEIYERADAGQHDGDEPAEVSRQDRTILLVEDEALIAMRQAAILTRSGYNVVKAHHAQEALELVSGRRIDLILMDIDLGPGKMYGTKAAEIIAREYDIPIVFLTSHTEKEYIEKVKNITGYG